jgi:hypothetical protein
MRLIQCLFAATAILSPSVAFAAADPAAPPPVPGEIRLSEAEKEKVLEAAAASNRGPVSTQSLDELGDDPLPPPIHGEVGFTIGSGGYRSAYGTAIVPLKNDGVAIISLGSTDFGRNRYVEPWWR